ncbi:MAG: cation:proton antiporter [Spirochaetales bacterium]|nr:cation:proton antiporter [Spirochaetales bacterium]
MHYLNESHILLFLIQLGIIIFLSRFIGELFRRIKQPVLTAELLIGILLGPTILGRFFPELFSTIFPNDLIQQNMLETVAWIGVLFLLLDTGLEINFSSAWKQKGNALLIALTDIIIPMIIAFIPCYFLPASYLVHVDKRIQFALFMAVVMTISAMPIASRILHDLNLLKTDLGYLTMSALAVNDIIGWALFTIILGLFAQSVFNIQNVLIILLVTIGFSFLALTAGRFLSNKSIDFFRKKNLPEPASSFTFACLVGVVFGAITQKIGIHALFGFFIAGVVVGEARNLKEETRSIISQMVHSLFVPVFFVNIGLKIDFISNFDFFLVSLVTLIGIAGRFLGAWIGVTFSRVPKINKALIAIAHTPGGMMEIVVALMAMELGLITPPIFIAIVCSAVFSSILMGPWMSFALKKRKDVKLIKYINVNSGIILLEEIDKYDAIKNIVSRISSYVKNINAQEIIEEIISREQEYSTAIGDGVAIPHVRIHTVSEPVLVFGLSKSGIDWNSPDGKSVNFIFFLLSPSAINDLHIEILSKIARKMQNKDNQITLLQAAGIKELTQSLKSICD